MQVTIERAKISAKKEGIDLTYSRQDEKGEPVETSEQFKGAFHPDLKLAFENMACHLAIMTGYVLPSQVKDITNPKEELFESFHVTSFSLGGTDDMPGVVVSGHKKLPNGKTVTLNTPFTLFNESEQTRYQFMDDLEERLERVKNEIIIYMKGEKRADDPQGSLFDQPKVTKAQILPEVDENTTLKDKGLGLFKTETVEEAKEVEYTPQTLPVGKVKKTKKVKQSADNPSGEVSED